MPRTPGTPRPPLCEVSPNTRSRIVSARDHGIDFKSIAELENLGPSTCRRIRYNASKQTSCISQPRSGRPQVLDARDHRRIFRTIANNPKITTARLRAEVAPHVAAKTIARFLSTSGLKKWRCRKRPLLTDERVAARLRWALLHDNKPLEYWQRWRWSDECSIERGKGGKWDFVYRKRGKVF